MEKKEKMSTVKDLTLGGELSTQDVLSLANLTLQKNGRTDERSNDLSTTSLSSSKLAVSNIIFFYASWNKNSNKNSPNCGYNIQTSWRSLWDTINEDNDDFDCINNILRESTSGAGLSSKIQMSMLEVDQDETCMSLCIGDNPLGEDDDCIGLSTIHCPAILPAISILVGNEIHFVSMQSSTILKCLQQQSQQNYEQLNVSITKLKTAIAKTMSDALQSDETKPKDMVVDKSIEDGAQELNLATRLFIAGDRSKVGKSSVCLGLLGSLLKQGYPPSSLAYIKPATQCEATQLVTEYCKRHGIEACRPIGPLLYYKGFTRAFLNGQTEDTNALLQKCAKAVDEIAQDKKIVLIDGVGYPAVGSICGTDNASVAKACGYPIITSSNTNSATTVRRLPVPTLIVGKSGVGDAIDSYNLNATYMRANDVPVIGGIFNRLSLDGFYSLDNCKNAVTAYFEKFKSKEGETAFGFIPEVPAIAKTRDTNNMDASLLLEEALENADKFVSTFQAHVDVKEIIARAQHFKKYRALETLHHVSIKRKILHNGSLTGNLEINDSSGHIETTKLESLKKMKLVNKTESKPIAIRLTREQIEEAAKSQGAAGG